MLVSNTLFGEVDKVQIAIDRIREFEPPEGYYVAFSGGKDSVVILDLVKRSGVKFDAHYNITGIDPPELFYFIRDEHPEVQRHRPEQTLWSLIIKKGFPPTRRIRYCCDVLKERGGRGRKVISGIRWAESARRKNQRGMVETCWRDTSKTFVNPIIDWSDEEVWEYIRGNNVSYCKLYDEGFKRLGCIMCGGASTANIIKEAERWPRYKEKYIRTFQKAIEAHPDKNPTHQENGQEMYRWWLREFRKVDKDQTIMFE